MKRPKVVVLTGAGISAESGIKTFRDHGGLWDNHDIMEVASIDGWHKNPDLVLRFYNERRKSCIDAKPNLGHLSLVELEEYYDVTIITQNVDNLHEKAGSSKVVHLHGELSKAVSDKDPEYIVDIGDRDIKIGDLCPEGHQLRPFIVWFGEIVPKIAEAVNLTLKADIFIIIGTSLNVYPAAELMHYLRDDVKCYLIDPKSPYIETSGFIHIKENATLGVPMVVKELLSL